MYLASRSDPAKSSFAEAIGGGDLAARWLIDDERGGALRGKVGLIEIGSGGTATFEVRAKSRTPVVCARWAWLGAGRRRER